MHFGYCGGIEENGCFPLLLVLLLHPRSHVGIVSKHLSLRQTVPRTPDVSLGAIAGNLSVKFGVMHCKQTTEVEEHTPSGDDGPGGGGEESGADNEEEGEGKSPESPDPNMEDADMEDSAGDANKEPHADSTENKQSAEVKEDGGDGDSSGSGSGSEAGSSVLAQTALLCPVPAPAPATPILMKCPRREREGQCLLANPCRLMVMTLKRKIRCWMLLR